MLTYTFIAHYKGGAFVFQHYQPNEYDHGKTSLQHVFTADTGRNKKTKTLFF